MKIKKNELMFFIGMTILAFRSLIQASIIIEINDFISNIILFIAYICFIFNIVINKINLREFRNLYFFTFYWLAYICFF